MPPNPVSIPPHPLRGLREEGADKRDFPVIKTNKQEKTTKTHQTDPNQKDC